MIQTKIYKCPLLASFCCTKKCHGETMYKHEKKYCKLSKKLQMQKKLNIAINN